MDVLTGGNAMKARWQRGGTMTDESRTNKRIAAVDILDAAASLTECLRMATCGLLDNVASNALAESACAILEKIEEAKTIINEMKDANNEG